MAKMLRIESCERHLTDREKWRARWSWRCPITKKVIWDMEGMDISKNTGIPLDCPLEDAPETAEAATCEKCGAPLEQLSPSRWQCTNNDCLRPVHIEFWSQYGRRTLGSVTRHRSVPAD